jgi:hypothetical protein
MKALVLKILRSLNLNRPDILCKAVSLFIDESMFRQLFWIRRRRRRSDIITRRKSHFRLISGQYNGAVISIAIIWILTIVQSDSSLLFRPICDFNIRNSWSFCPVQLFWSNFTQIATSGVVCEQLAVVSNRTIWLAELKMSIILLTIIPTDVCEIELCEVFTFPFLEIYYRSSFDSSLAYSMRRSCWSRRSNRISAIQFAALWFAALGCFHRQPHSGPNALSLRQRTKVLRIV